MELSTEQIEAISARSETPASDPLDGPRLRAASNSVGAIELGPAEKAEGIGQVLDRQPGFLGKTLRRQIVAVAIRGHVRDFDIALLDAALEVGVDETKRDAEFGGDPPLRLGAVPLDGFQKTQHDLGFLEVAALRLTGHRLPLLQVRFYGVHVVNVKTIVHRMNMAALCPRKYQLSQ